MIPFAKADEKFIILGTSFFNKDVQNVTIHDFTMNFEISFKDQTIIDSFTTLIEKNFPFTSFFIEKVQDWNVFSNEHCTNITLSTEHVPNFIAKCWNSWTIFCWNASNYFSVKIETILSLSGIFNKKIWKILLSGFQQIYYAQSYISNLTNRIYTKSYYHCDTISFFKSFLGNKDSSGSSYLPSWNYWAKQTSILRYETKKTSAGLNDIDFFENPILNSVASNGQPSQTIAPHVFLSLPHPNGKLQLLKKILFSYSDLNDSEEKQIWENLVENKRSYAARHNDMGIISTPILLYCNLMLKCKRKNLLKFLFIIGTNWLLYRLI